MASHSSAAPNPFEPLRQPQDAEVVARQQEERHRKVNEQNTKAQQRLAEQIDANQTRPVTLSAITVLNANNTREGFLHRIFNPLLTRDNEPPYTLSEAIQAVGYGVDRLKRFDMFELPISTYFDIPDKANPSSTPTDLAAYIAVREKPRFSAHSGAWAGSNDGSVSGDLHLRNIFGGDENFTASISRGTRIRTSYSALFSTPILSDPNLRWEVSGWNSTILKSWMSAEEVIRGATTRLRWLSNAGNQHELKYEGAWRCISAVGEKASATVRQDAGDTVKSAMSYSWTRDTRDNPFLPGSGYLLKASSELAGLGALKGDVAHSKTELESQIALPIPIPFSGRTPTETGISFTAGLRGGLLYPLPLTTGDPRGKTPQATRINDRFMLGGPTDVRGFRIAGLGPRDGNDSVGGDVFAAGGCSLYVPFWRTGKDAPVRLQLFMNSGRLLGLHGSHDSDMSKGDGKNISNEDVRQSVQTALKELGNGLPSTAVGLGLVYALPVARFEVNFSLPLVIRQGEEARKGVSVGVGMDFL